MNLEALRKVGDWITLYERVTTDLCLKCNKTVVVMKEYNMKRHYATKHANTYEKFEGQVKKDKF